MNRQEGVYLNKKTIIKYVYFTILLLLPYVLVFLPIKGDNPFMIFLGVPWLITNLLGMYWIFDDVFMVRSILVIYCLIFMSISFVITSKLYKIHKEKPDRLYTFLSIVLLFLLFTLFFGEPLRIFLFLICGFLTFCPLYFWGISFYNKRFIVKEQKVEDDNISKKINL